MTPEIRLALGTALAAVVALVAQRRRLLSVGGAWGAVACGTIATGAGWSWCAALLAFFGSSVALSRWRRDRKDAATGDLVEKVGARDAMQVLANGGVFTCCAFAALVAPSPWWPVAGIGAIAAATADTWATEVGTALGGAPRSLVGLGVVPPGTSGAVSVAGTLAMLLGSIVPGTAAVFAGFDPWMAVATAAGGVTGALVDTLLGATIQERRWCPACQRATEQRLHRCGTPTTPAGGLALMDNDAVNLTSTIAGALAGVGAAGWLA